MPNRGENGVLVVLDYLWHADGMRLPRSMIEAAIDVWKAQADIADESVALKAGGTEPRFRLSGMYDMTAPPKSVLPLMLVPMDAQLYLRGDGAITINVGKFVAPTVTLTDAHIVDYSGMARARDRSDIRNQITAQFVSPDYNYIEQDADAWEDQGSIDIDGLQTASLDLTWAPSHAQARRRMKVEAYRQNPGWSGQIVTNAYGLRCIDQRFVQVQIDELEIDDTFEVQKWAFDPLSGNCTLQIAVMPAAAYSWNAATEEGTPPGASATAADTAVEQPEEMAVDIQGSSPANILVAVWDTPQQLSLTPECDWRTHDDAVTDEVANWYSMIVSGGGARSGQVPNDTYDVRARFIDPGGAMGEYTFVRGINVPTGLDLLATAGGELLVTGTGEFIGI